MSQESHNSHAHQDDNKAAVSFGASFWVVIILVGVFICALNFVQVMSKEGGDEKEGTKTEMKAGSTETKSPEKPAEETKKADVSQTEAKH